jgi:hypothetical protein
MGSNLSRLISIWRLWVDREERVAAQGCRRRDPQRGLVGNGRNQPSDLGFSSGLVGKVEEVAANMIKGLIRAYGE